MMNMKIIAVGLVVVNALATSTSQDLNGLTSGTGECTLTLPAEPPATNPQAKMFNQSSLQARPAQRDRLNLRKGWMTTFQTHLVVPSVRICCS